MSYMWNYLCIWCKLDQSNSRRKGKDGEMRFEDFQREERGFVK